MLQVTFFRPQSVEAYGQQVVRYSALTTVCRMADPDGLSFASTVDQARSCVHALLTATGEDNPGQPSQVANAMQLIGPAVRERARGLLFTETACVSGIEGKTAARLAANSLRSISSMNSEQELPKPLVLKRCDLDDKITAPHIS